MRELNQPESSHSRGDALAGSPHTRLVDQLRPPTHDHDPDRAAEICATVCRQTMLDYAPALMLVPPHGRLRIQAVSAYTITLLDFARQPGLEGERLAGLNRWQFELEEALDGHPTGQPVFVRLALAEAKQPWLRDEFDRLHRAARHLAVTSSAVAGDMPDQTLIEIADAWLALVLGVRLNPATVQQGAAVLRVHDLLNAAGSTGSVAIESTHRVAEESKKLRRILTEPIKEEDRTHGYRAAANYLRLASLALLRALDSSSGDRSRPSIGLFRRLIILGRARWLET